jgi:hypothetical protein
MNVFKYVIKNTYNFLDTSHFLYNFWWVINLYIYILSNYMFSFEKYS